MEAENIPGQNGVYQTERNAEKARIAVRDKYPDQGIHISYRDIIKPTVSISDNNTCDWLIGFVGGIKWSLHKISWDKGYEFHREKSMHTDIMLCYNN